MSIRVQLRYFLILASFFNHHPCGGWMVEFIFAIQNFRTFSAADSHGLICLPTESIFKFGCNFGGEILTKKNPFPKENCKDKWCPLCKGEFGEIKMDCRTNNVGYRWVCRTCEKTKNVKKIYEGETSRSI